jgi:hypothetical protein
MVPHVDDALWPIVKISYGATIELDEIPEFGMRLLRVFQGRGPFVTLADISELRPTQVTALHRKRIAEEADKLAARGAFIAEAVIIRNPLVRALYVGYQWARSGKSHPCETFADPLAALAWAREQAQRTARGTRTDLG